MNKINNNFFKKGLLFSGKDYYNLSSGRYSDNDFWRNSEVAKRDGL